MSDRERDNFAAWLRAVQRDRGSAKAAYTEVEVNSATWTRATKGLTIKDHSVAKIVKKLRPDLGGDWTGLGLDQGVPTVGSPEQDAAPGYVSAPGERVEGEREDRVLDAIEEMRRDMQALSARVERLEEQGP